MAHVGRARALRSGLVAAFAVAVVGGLIATGSLPGRESASAQEEAPPVEGAAEASEEGSDRQDGDGGRGDPDVVRVGALINDVQQLDLQSHSYNVDMYMWFKWDNPDIDPSRSFEFLNAFEFWGHILTYETSKPEVLRDGTHYQVLRNQGKFNTKLPLEEYPFDTQHLVMTFEDSSADASELVFVPDEDPITLSRDLAIPGWEIGEPTLEVISNQYDSNFGDPRYGKLAYSRAIIDLPLERPAGTYALKLLLPLLLVALTAALSLMVHPQFVEGRIGIGITALLTLVALQITSNSSLPEVDYLILLDKLYIASYAFVVLTMAIIVRNSWVDATGDISAAVRADRTSLALLTAVYFAVSAVLLITTLT
jgi:hypothetical protein